MESHECRADPSSWAVGHSQDRPLRL